MKLQKIKALSLRLDSELYQKIVDRAIKQTNKEKRLVKASEVIREILEKGVEI